MQTTIEPSSNSKSKRVKDFELDTPYFRRSMMMRENPDLKFMALRIDQFLTNLGVTQVKIEDEPIDYSESRKEVDDSPSGNSDMSVKTRLSSANINLGENNLYLRRKTSTNAVNLSSIKPEQSA